MRADLGGGEGGGGQQVSSARMPVATPRLTISLWLLITLRSNFSEAAVSAASLPFFHSFFPCSPCFVLDIKESLAVKSDSPLGSTRSR